MDKRKVKSFKKQQELLAKKIAKQLGCADFKIEYEQKIPSACIHSRSGRLTIGDSSQIIFETPTIYASKSLQYPLKHRLIVNMFFNGYCNVQKLNNILKRQFSYEVIGHYFEITFSVNPHTVSKC